ncbi:(2Fe-2S)-binding protein, partial [Chloroflexota bacterium]
VNNAKHELSIYPNMTLLSVLRDELGLTGTKEGCQEGSCGACTVLVDGKAVRSCLLLAMEAEGKDIITIEGLAENGQLHPIQQSFVDRGAIQCGFCSSGMILTAKSLLDENRNPMEDEIRKALSGNLCRCTGYVNIVEAIMAVAKKHE